MKNIKLLFALFIISILTLSCSKDEPAAATVAETPNYKPIGYFQGTFNVADDSLKLIFVFENENKLLVGFNATTLTTSTALLKGSYTVTGNKITGTFINPNAIPIITYNFTGDFDPKTAKYVATFTGTGTNFSNSGTIVLDKIL
jgi:hypothetical protein